MTDTLPSDLEKVGIVPTVGVPGLLLLDTLMVRVLDDEGAPAAGVVVTWAVREGGGTVEVLNDSTDAEGLSRARWRLGSAPGGWNELGASLVGGAQTIWRAHGEVFRASYVIGDGLLRSCALITGAIWCWGYESAVHGPPVADYDGFAMESDSPGLLDSSRTYVALTEGGGGQICALDDQGSVWCTDSEARPPLAQVAGIPPLATLRGDPGSPVCGVAQSDGRGWCGVEGSPTPLADSLNFLVIDSDSDWLGRLTCGLLADSTAVCWGTVPAGNGSATPSAEPVPVSGGHRFVELAVGSQFACGRTAGSELWCWGTNFRGGPVFLAPQLVAGNVLAVRATLDMLLVEEEGGQLRRGLGPDLRADDVPVRGLDDGPVAGLAADGVGCLIRTGGEVYCVEENWDRSSEFAVYNYLPVQPINRAPGPVRQAP